MLVNCTAYQQGIKVAHIAPEKISNYLTQPDTFVWVALADASPEELAQMQEEFSLHALAVEDARHGHQRPKIEEYGDSIFAVLKNLEYKEDSLHTSEINIFVGRNYVLSNRPRNIQGFIEVRSRCESEPHLLKFGSGFVFYALIDAVVDRYFPIIDSLEEELDAIETNLFNRQDPHTNIQGLYGLKQKLNTLRHVVFPLMEATGKLYGGRVPAICADTQEYFRDVHDHLSRISQSIDDIRDMLGTAIQVNLSLIALHENAVTKKLAAWAALIAVPTMIAGIYGMNFEHMPELKWAWAYPASIGVMLLLDLFLYWRFKKTKWL